MSARETNGKVERFFRTAEEKIHEFRSVDELVTVRVSLRGDYGIFTGTSAYGRIGGTTYTITSCDLNALASSMAWYSALSVAARILPYKANLVDTSGASLKTDSRPFCVFH